MRTLIPRLGLALAGSLALSGCAASLANVSSVQHHKQEASVLYSSPVRDNVTPLDKALACLGGKLKQRRGKPVGIAVGDIKDYTGKQGQDEGYAITQGGALMAYSALGKMAGGVRVHERFDTRIAEAELVYMNQRQLGDGQRHQVDDPATGQSVVPWKPYFGGSILQSDYFIVGGITELNYNIQSGGAEIAVSNVGPKARVYTMNVAVDLRIVGSQSLMVYDTISVEKQLTGYEVGIGVFRFFGNDLFDVNIGAKNQEPLQLGVRMAIEMATLQLIASVARTDPSSCVPAEFGPVEWDGANAEVAHRAASQGAAQKQVAAAPVETPGAVELAFAQPQAIDPAAVAATEQAAKEIYELEPASAAIAATAPSGGSFSIVFAKASDQLDQIGQAKIGEIAAAVQAGRSVNLTLADDAAAGGDAPDGKAFDETLRNDRIRSIIVALMRQGISRGKAQLIWQASAENAPAEGTQDIARIRIG